MNTIEEKCALIEEFIREYGSQSFSIYSKEYIEFLQYNDLGVPIAQSVCYGLVDLTDEGEMLVEETWNNLCKMVNTDPEYKYDSIFEMGEAEDNE
jgi:hypothetical protein